MDFPMMTTLMSKNKLKTLGFVNCLSKSKTLLDNIEPLPIAEPPKVVKSVPLKRPREENEPDQDAKSKEESASNKKRCIEPVKKITETPVEENKSVFKKPSKDYNQNFRRLNMKGKFGGGGGGGKFKGSKFLSKGAKFKRRQWSNKSRSGPVRYGMAIKKTDSDSEEVNQNIIMEEKEQNDNEKEEKIDETSNEAIFARLAKKAAEKAEMNKPNSIEEKSGKKKKTTTTTRKTKATSKPTNKENNPKNVENTNNSTDLIADEDDSTNNTNSKKSNSRKKEKSTGKSNKSSASQLKETQNSPKLLKVKNGKNKTADKKTTSQASKRASDEIENMENLAALLEQDEEEEEAVEEKMPKTSGPLKPLFDLDSNGEPIKKLPGYALKMLEKHFGHKSFKPNQEEAIIRILSGLSTLVILSTGYGKSLIYQFCAKAYAERYSDGAPLVLVVSPLISLMQDQVKNLSKSLKAAVCDSQMSERDFNGLRESLANGTLNILFMSPEAILARKIRHMPRLAFVCIDEVHCLSQWSHNFRPSYLLLSKILLEEYNVKCILGLTATATHGTIEEIRQHFDINPGNILRDCDLPRNLLITASRDSNKESALLSLLKSEPFRSTYSDHVIIYCSRREQTERLAHLLRLSLARPKKSLDLEKLKNKRKGVNDDDDEDENEDDVAEAYHAGLNAHQRRRIQNKFVRGRVKIIVATMAFGMGIDMPNIRAVIHYNMPKSIENYVQEVGRAGRDSKESLCHVFLETHREDINEIKRYVHMNGYDRLTIKKFLAKIFHECKCESGKTTTQIEENQQNTDLDAFSKHHVALPMSETVDDLDIKEEAILTLLCYLQSAKYVKIESNCYRYATLRSYKGLDYVREMAKNGNRFVAAVLGCAREHNGNELRLDVMEVCERAGCDYGVVRQRLKSLEWSPTSNAKSGITVELSGPAFYVRRACLKDSDELDDLNELLWRQVSSQSEFAYANFKSLFRILNEQAHENIHDLTDQLSESKEKLKENSISLKEHFNHYFNNRFDIREFSRGYDFGLKRNGNEENNEHELKRLVADIRKFLSVYEGEFKVNGQVIARIFHGIPTPKFPSEIWGRNRNFWRSHLEFDYDRIVKVATEQLLKF